jgi:hypothetical protein
MAANHHSIVMHGDLTGVEVDVGPPQATDLSASYSRGEFEEKERSEAIAAHRSQELLYVLSVPHSPPRT